LDNSRRDAEVKKDTSIFTKETFGMLTVLFSVLCFICLLTRDSVFSTLGLYVNYFFFGTFGYFAFVECILCAIFGVMMVMGKNLNFSKKVTLHALIVSTCVVFLVHAISSSSFDLSTYGSYLSDCYTSASVGVSGATGGGLITGLFVYWVMKLFTPVGFYVIISVALALDTYIIVKNIKKNGFARGKVNMSAPEQAETVQSTDNQSLEQREEEQTIVPELHPIDFTEPNPKSNLFIAEGSAFSYLGRREQTPDVRLNSAGKGLNVAYIPVPEDNKVTSKSDIRSKVDYIRTPNVEDAMNTLRRVRGEDIATNSISSEIKKETKSTENVDNLARRTVYGDYYSADYMSGNASNTNLSNESFSNKTEREILREKVLGGDYNFNVPTNSYAEETVKDQPTTSTASDTEENYETVYDEPTFEVEEDTYQVEESEQPNVYEEEFETFDEIDMDAEVEETSEIIDANAESVPNEEPTLPERTFIADEEDVQEMPSATKTPRVSAMPSVSKTPSVSQYDTEEDDDEYGLPKAPKNRGRGPDLAPRKSRVVGFSNTPIAPAPTEQPRQAFTAPEPIPSKPEPIIEPINRPYFTPGFNVFVDHAKGVATHEEDHAGRIKKIEDKLAGFRLPVQGEGYVQGPSITRYEFAMPEGASVKKVLPYDADLMATLEVKDGVRILAPIPGKNLVGVEVANSVRVPVPLKTVLEETAMKEHKKGLLMFIIGKSVIGEPIEDDLTKGPHYLVAGSTGSGKSVFLNSLLISLIMRYSPEDLKLILIDPKLVEFSPYEHLPHLVTDEILTDYRKVLAMLDWAIGEMERRNQMFRDCPGAVKDINDYNKVMANDKVQRLPRIVIVVDELADLMLHCKKDLEQKIQAIAQKARSAGIHLVIATQRPSTDVITGTIKTNLPSRVAFRVTNYVDSMTILAEGGAEKLLGRGDMLYKNSEMSNLDRYQGTYLSPEEIDKVVSYIIKNNKAYFNQEVAEMLERVVKPQEPNRPMAVFGGGIADDDPLFIQALRHVIESEVASTSMLQRRFQIGHSRAGGIIDKMEGLGYISGNEGCKSRRVLLTMEEFEEKYGGLL